MLGTTFHELSLGSKIAALSANLRRSTESISTPESCSKLRLLVPAAYKILPLGRSMACIGLIFFASGGGLKTSLHSPTSCGPSESVWAEFKSEFFKDCCGIFKRLNLVQEVFATAKMMPEINTCSELNFMLIEFLYACF